MSETEQTPKADIGGLVKVGTPFDAKSYIEAIKSAIVDGTHDPLAIYTVLKRMNKVSEEVFKDSQIQKIINDEADKYLSGNQKTFELYSSKITKMAVYTTHDFSECGHPELDELYKIREQVEERIKLVEEELKLLIPKETSKPTLGIESDSKDIIVGKMPFLKWEEHGDQVTVKAPKKIQKIGLKYMKI